MNVRSLERALALRRMVIARMQVPPDEEGYAARLKLFEQKASEVEHEAEAARISSLFRSSMTSARRRTMQRWRGLKPE